VIKLKNAFQLGLGGLALCGCLYAFQRPWRLFESLERYDDIPIPADGQDPAEFVFARLMYPSLPYAKFEYRHGDWREGGTGWTEDYPRADRHFATALRRLSRVDARSLEQPVNPDDVDDIYNWPWLYGGLVGNWDLSDEQAAKIREFLLRGGFFYADDFWGPDECRGFETGMKKIFPNRDIVDLTNEEALFHTVYDLDNRYQILGEWGLRGPRSGPRDGGITPQWRGIRDDKGRLMVAISANSDIGDSWEFADAPAYPEKFSALGIRIGVNYVMYSMTH
jgi:hypothetical protein